MDKLMTKLLELEQTRECLEKCQMSLREQFVILDGEEYSEKMKIYNKNKEELTEINKKMEILNNALDIIDGIGV